MNSSTKRAASTGPRPRRRGRAAATALITLCAVAWLAACSSSGSSSPSSSPEASGSTSPYSSGQEVGVALILESLSNPYFVTMEKDAQAAAAKDGVRLTVTGSSNGDTQTQIAAIDDAIAVGDKGILITTNGNAVNPALNQARQAGLFVIALDTPPTPATAVDITYATSNIAAGKLDGEYAAQALGGKPAVIAMLDLYNTQVVSVDIDRDHGFLEGMGINPGNPNLDGTEAKKGTYSGGGPYTIACHQPTQGTLAGGRTAMEDCLSADPGINVVYAINEPGAEGAYEAVKAAGKQKHIMVFAIDGSCAGLKMVASGEFKADAVQYPGKMALLGMEAIAALARGGAKPTVTRGLSFYNTGTALVALKPYADVPIESPAQGAAACWGS